MPSFASYLLEREKGSFAILLRREGIKDQKKKKEGDWREFFVQKIFLSLSLFYGVLCCPLQDKNTISFYSITPFLFSLTKISSDKQFH